MKIIRTLDDLRARTAKWKRKGRSIAVVPTMGALHDGHLSLVDAACAACDRVIVTLFVNPKQFDNPDDLAKYPRTEEGDAAQLRAAGAHVLFAPTPDQVYPPGFATRVSVSGLSEGLCGAHRPGHFDGVATVVPKLFLMTGADRAFFGEKDWQQLQIVRRLVADLNIPIRITGCPTLREADGLAMSSRNLRLSPDDRAAAPALYRAMAQAGAAIAAGAPVEVTLAQARDQAVQDGFARVEYLELCDPETLRPMTRADRPGRLLAAAWLGEVRLIDNIAVAAADGGDSVAP